MELLDIKLSNLGAQKKNASWYQVSDVENIVFWIFGGKILTWTRKQSFVEAKILCCFFSIFNKFGMGWMAEKPIPIDADDEK